MVSILIISPNCPLMFVRSGEGRGDDTGRNLYENFAESTSGSTSALPQYGVNFALDAQNMEAAAAEEEAKDKRIKVDYVKKQLRKRLGDEGTRSAPATAVVPEVDDYPDSAELEGQADADGEVVVDEEGEGEETAASRRARASESRSLDEF